MPLFGPPSIKKLEAKRDVTGLRRIVQEADPWRSRDAVVALANIATDDAVDAIIAALRDGPASTRLVAAEALGRLGSVRAAPALIARLDDHEGAWLGASPAFSPWGHTEYGEVCGSAFDALCRLAPQIVNLSAASLLQESPLPLATRWSPAHWQGSEAGWRGANEPAGRADEAARAKLAQILGKSADRRAVPPLIAALDAKSHGIREAAAHALGELKDRRAVDPLLKALDTKSHEIREAAMWALGELGDQRATPAIIDWLESPQHGRLRNPTAMEALVKLGPRDQVLPILRRYYFRAVEDSFGSAELGSHGVSWSGLLEQAEAALEQQEQRARAADAARLARLKASRDARELVTMLDDRDAGVRSAAEAALISKADPDAIEPLVSLLSHEQADVVAAAARVLTRLGDARGSAWVLIDAARRDERSLYDRAARILERAGAEAVPLLGAAAHDESAAVRWSVAHVLGRSGAEEAVPLLIELMDDADEGVREAALAGLQRIGGRDAQAAIAAYGQT